MMVLVGGGKPCYGRKRGVAHPNRKGKKETYYRILDDDGACGLSFKWVATDKWWVLELG
jgi:hypothetical protein